MTDAQVEAALKAWSDARVHGFADEHRAMRAALAAAQAGVPKYPDDWQLVGHERDSLRAQGFAAGIEAAAEIAAKYESPRMSMLVSDIRALRPPAATAEG